ncbi:MAG: hypothetical protein ACW967_11285 [Candidatus Hodarchaeales archaeon]|jgi:hypothetical protein
MSLLYWKDKIYVSKGTTIGFLIFGSALAFILINDYLRFVILTERILAMICGLSLITFLLGFILDQLITRDFNFWAFGALVSFIGVAVFFSPVILYGLGSSDLPIWFLLVIIGILLIIFGYGIEATEINKKFAKILLSMFELVKSYNWKALPGKFLYLNYFLIRSLMIYVATGLKNLKELLTKAFSEIYIFLKKSLKRIYDLITDLPRIFYKTIESFIQFSIWLIIPSSIVIGLSFTTPMDLGFISLIIVAIIYFSTLFIYKNKEQVANFVSHTSEITYGTYLYTNRKYVSLKQKLGIYKCSNCNSKISLTSEKCDTCEIDLTSCMICKLPIQTGSSKHNCEQCQNAFHENHYTQWIRINKVCPVCRIKV